MNSLFRDKQFINLLFSFIILFLAEGVLSEKCIAQSKIDSLKELLHKDLNTEENIRVQIELANEYLSINPLKAEEYLSQLEIAIDSNSTKEIIIEYLLVKSKKERQEGNYKQAKITALKALEITNSYSNTLKYKANIYNSLGLIEDDDSNIETAINHQLKALRFAENLDNSDLLASILADIGRAYLYLSEYDIAKSYFQRAISIKVASNSNDIKLAAYYTNLSNCLDAEAKYDSSLLYLDNAIQINLRNKNIVKLITSYNNKAYTLLLMKRYAEAEKIIQLALQLANSKEVIEAEKMYPYSTYAEILIAQNRINEASSMLEKSVELSKKYNDLYLAKYNLDLLYNIYLKKENYQQALAYFKQKSIVKDTIYNVSSRKEIEKLALEYDTEKKNKAIELLNKENEINAIKLKKSNQLVLAFLMVAILSVLVVSLLWLHQKNKRKTDKIIKEAMQRGFEKQLANSELQALRAQMNPHFLFNCLNSINSFIIKNEQEKASEYLSKFSKLIRRVLSNSKSSKVTLANELEALELYIELEALRFNEKFSYKISVDSEIETDYIEIPPLIIQPYVENSIWHGLMHKTNGTGALNIDIRKEEEALVCIIEDNGIGREAAKQVKSKTAIKRKSYGMNITKERLQYINYNNGHNGKKETTNIDVIDLKDEAGNPTGTRVMIKIKAEK